MNLSKSPRRHTHAYTRLYSRLTRLMPAGVHTRSTCIFLLCVRRTCHPKQDERRLIAIAYSLYGLQTEVGVQSTLLGCNCQNISVGSKGVCIDRRAELSPLNHYRHPESLKSSRVPRTTNLSRKAPWYVRTKRVSYTSIYGAFPGYPKRTRDVYRNKHQLFNEYLRLT